MNWLIWMQYRKQVLMFTGLLAVFAAVVIPTGLHYWSAYQGALANCATTNTCDTLQSVLFQNDQVIMRAIGVVALVVPFLLGLFLGAPLLAREYEDGTNKLIWTQGVSRRKWLTAKLLWVLAFATLYGLAMTLLMTWWSRTGNALYQTQFFPTQFDVQGYVPMAYAIFATALGSLMGAWFKRAMLALGVTLAVLAVLQAGVAYGLRPHYAQPITLNKPIATDNARDSELSGDTWLLSRNAIDGKGVVYDSITSENIPPQCKDSTGPAGFPKCLKELGWQTRSVYHPANRYWDFQLIETLIYLGLTSLAVGATYWLVLRRDA